MRLLVLVLLVTILIAFVAASSMAQMSKKSITFVTGNAKKLEEVRAILGCSHRLSPALADSIFSYP
jgi:hypothetical protein